MCDFPVIRENTGKIAETAGNSPILAPKVPAFTKA